MKPSTIHALAESRIKEARARGLFDDLPGAGEPLPEDRVKVEPGGDRMAARVASMVGHVPLEIQLGRRIKELRLLAFERKLTEAESKELRDASIRLAVLHQTAGRHLTASKVPFMPG